MSATIGEIATLAHGYTMAEVDKAARFAVNHCVRGRMLDMSDRWDHAWYAVVELLYTAEERPTEHELMLAGSNAIRLAANRELHHHGINPNTLEPTPSCAKYWLPISAPVDFTDRITEQLALPQVLGQLTVGEYEAIAALAVHGTHTAAAASIGVERAAFSARTKRARARILALWLEHETPVGQGSGVPSDTACRYGHDRAEHGYKTKRGGWACRVCRRNINRRTRARNR